MDLLKQRSKKNRHLVNSTSEIHERNKHNNPYALIPTKSVTLTIVQQINQQSKINQSVNTTYRTQRTVIGD